MDEPKDLRLSMKSEYVESNELRHYIWKNYKHALTERESALHRAALLELKARHIETKSADSGASLRGKPGYFFDADVAAIAELGLETYVEKCCERLLRDYENEIYINRCERCNRIVVSPIACTCLWCGHHWYERRSEMMARAASSIYPP